MYFELSYALGFKTAQRAPEQHQTEFYQSHGGIAKTSRKKNSFRYIIEKVL